MARLKKGGIPAYRRHKARNCAVVTIAGQDHYLGPYGSPSSRRQYAALIKAWQDGQDDPQELGRQACPGERPPHGQ